ncbi:hypothetical protein MAR_031318, partial [Mya arenaria]
QCELCAPVFAQNNGTVYPAKQDFGTNKITDFAKVNVLQDVTTQNTLHVRASFTIQGRSVNRAMMAKRVMALFMVATEENITKKNKSKVGAAVVWLIAAVLVAVAVLSVIHREDSVCTLFCPSTRIEKPDGTCGPPFLDLIVSKFKIHLHFMLTPNIHEHILRCGQKT